MRSATATSKGRISTSAPPCKPEGRYATIANVNFRQIPNGTVLRQRSSNSVVVTHDDTIGWLSAPFLHVRP